MSMSGTASQPNAATPVVSALRAFLALGKAETTASRSMVSGAKSARAGALLGRIGRAAIGGAILVYLFTFIPVSEVGSALASAEPAWLALAFILLAAERLTGAVRVTVLSRHLRMPLSLLKNCEIALVSTFYGTLLPGVLAGGAIRWYRMSQPNQMRAEAAAVVTFDRLTGTITLVSLGLIFWFLENPPATKPGLQGVLLVLLAGLIGGLCFSLSRRATSIVLKPTAVAAKRLRLDRVYAAVVKVSDSVQRFRRLPPRELAALITAAAARELVRIGFVFAFAHALGLNVGFVTLGWVCSFLGIALMLPVSFSGIGVREGAFVLLLAPYGVSGSSAIALAILMTLAHLLVAGAGGALELKNLLGGVLRPGDPASTGPDRNHLPGQAI